MRSAVGVMILCMTSGCLNWNVPGETLVTGPKMRAVRDRVLEAAAKESPGCRRQQVTDTQIVDLHPDAKVAIERWTVTGCGEKLDFMVRFPPTGRGTGFLVEPDK